MKKRNIVLFAMMTLVIDQIIKVIIKTCMAKGTSISIIKNFFNITFVVNEGAAFSMFIGMQFFLILIAFILLIAIYFMFIKDKNLKNSDIILYGVLIGGILGNLIDRIYYNGVIDYLDFILFNYDAPIFNLADICIVIPMCILAFKELGGNKNEF